MYMLNNREVDITDTNEEDGMIQVTGAYFIDTGEDLTEDEMLVLEKAYQASLYEDWYSSRIDYAHDYFEDQY